MTSDEENNDAFVKTNLILERQENQTDNDAIMEFNPGLNLTDTLSGFMIQ